MGADNEGMNPSSPLADPSPPARAARGPMEDLVAVAHRTAEAHALWPELVCAIVEQESAWDPWALRYEPAFYDKYIATSLTARRPDRQASRLAAALTSSEIPDDPTESRARAFSWGLMQVMGQVAREHGFTGALASLCDPAVGLEIGCRVFAAKLAAAEGNVTRALLLWNGAGNQAYPAAVLARTARYA
jgi:soluble lytic murein transglycosylase-like protein